LIEPITPEELKAWLDDDSRESPIVIDVREGWEHAKARVEGSLHMPMQTVPDRLGELESGQAFVLMCHHGMRSYRVAEFLESNGFSRLYNLSGGIEAWACEIDPSLARY